MCTALLPPGVNPTAVNKYIIYHKMHKTVALKYNNVDSAVDTMLTRFYLISKFVDVFMFIPCISNNKCLLCADMCTNKCCKFVLNYSDMFRCYELLKGV